MSDKDLILFLTEGKFREVGYKKSTSHNGVLRERGCMPARTFVLIIKCVARPNICEPPALAKPPPRV